MPAIAIVDDRKDKLETMHRVVFSTLKKLKETKTWSVVAEGPPPNERDVLHWLDESDATVLVSDWKLNEGGKSERVVNYEADRLIREIRTKRPNFPIFVVTGFEPEARAHLKDVENVFNRDHFTRNVEIILPQILRAGLRRYEGQRELLTRMDALARRVAGGTASKKEQTELKGLQGYFQVELPAILTLDGVLAEFENAKKRAIALQKKVQRRIDDSAQRVK